MENVVLSPAPGQTVVSANSDPFLHQHHNHGHHGHCDTSELANYRALTQQVERFGTINGDRTNTGVQVTGDRIAAVGAAGALAASHATEVALAGFDKTGDRICGSTKDITGAVTAGFTDAALAACKTNDAIGDSKLFSAVQFKDQIIAGNLNASNLSNLVQTIGNASTVLATTIGNAQQVQSTNYFNQTTVQVERVRAELDAKVAAGFAAAALLAFQNKADSDAKAAACCCELKEKITAEATATRALINEIEARRVATELQRLQTQVAILTGGVVGARAAA